MSERNKVFLFNLLKNDGNDSCADCGEQGLLLVTYVDRLLRPTLIGEGNMFLLSVFVNMHKIALMSSELFGSNM